MEQNFQTSFIPKRPIVEETVVRSRPASLFTILSIFIFFTIVIASGGVYFYKGSLSKQIDQMTSDLEIAKNRFEPATIAKFVKLDKRLNSANEILSNHTAISPIFDLLQKITLKTIRYSKFSYVLGDTSSSKITVQMSGQAIGYRSIALQSDLFTQHNKDIIDPVFSNLSLDPKGNVIFDLEFSIDPSFVNYQQLVAKQATVQ
ncbi:MAG: hypothetical protein NTW62_02870 [Candidatus Nomurabacteria bacterium]|nr:hypothetical protein [Candidatus Nomurabacteria bacterium]